MRDPKKITSFKKDLQRVFAKTNETRAVRRADKGIYE